jgi:polyisoprenoid-binding protein YceI
MPTYRLAALLLLSPLLLGLAVPAHAVDRYQIDPLHSFASFEYSHWGLSYQRGRFDKTSGSIELDMDAHAGAVNLEIDATSVSTGSEVFDKIMRSDSFFDVEHFPKITFNSTRLVFDQDQLKQVEGQLTIRDVTKDVVVEVTRFSCRFMVVYLRRACGANGQAAILRSDFKMGSYAPFVSDEVTLYFTIEGIAQ